MMPHANTAVTLQFMPNSGSNGKLSYISQQYLMKNQAYKFSKAVIENPANFFW